MEELKIVEKGLVPVYETSAGEKVVYGTELHKTLGAPSAYREWVKRRLKDVDAVENEDFSTVEISTVVGGAHRKEHIIQLDTAKEMAMLERNEKGKQVRRYFIALEKRYKLAQRIAMEQREEVLQILQEQSERIDGLEYKLSGYHMGTTSCGFNPFNLGNDVLNQRMRTLNGLIDQVADLCQMERNKVLHFLYKTMQESLGVTLNPYLAVMKSERGDESVCNLHVIACVDRFYQKAVEMCQDVIDRKNLFG